jgi:hypothetical protein
VQITKVMWLSRVLTLKKKRNIISVFLKQFTYVNSFHKSAVSLAPKSSPGHLRCCVSMLSGDRISLYEMLKGLSCQGLCPHGPCMVRKCPLWMGSVLSPWNILGFEFLFVLVVVVLGFELRMSRLLGNSVPLELYCRSFLLLLTF